MKLARRTSVSTIFLTLVLLLSACSPGLRAPLLSPRAVVGSFGYSETQTQPDRYDVVFVGPRRVTYSPPGSGDRLNSEDVARREAYDLSAWRASQIALARGYIGFKILDTRSNIDGVHYTTDYGGGWGPSYGYGRGISGVPGMYGGGWGGFPEDAGYSFQVTQTLSVRLLKVLEAGDYDAQQVIDQLRAAYPGAEGTAPGR